MDEMKYIAFISYRHGGNDEYAAHMLHRQLENYHIPAAIAAETGKKRVGRIFRDVDELPTSDSLYQNIEDALHQSRFLIVICTPRLKESQWCMREIELFIKLRGVDSVLAVLAEGEPEESFPDILTHRIIDGKEVRVEPLAADVRGNNKFKVKSQIKTERLRLLAAMLDCEFDQLRQRAKQQIRLRRGIGLSLAAIVVVAFLGMMGMENLRLQKQVSRTQIAQSYLLSQYAQNSYQGDDPMTAALLSLEALPEQLGNSRPFVGDAMASLTTALQIYNYQQGYVADHKISTETMDSSFISPDGTYLTYVDLNKSGIFNIHFYDIQGKKVVANFEVNDDINSYMCTNHKVAFFGDHYCVISGADGTQMLNLKTMEVQWTGDLSSSVEISADESVIAAYDHNGKKVTFYRTNGEKISSSTLDCEDSVVLGLKEDGTKYAVILYQEDDRQLVLIDTTTGEIERDLTRQLQLQERQELDVCTENCAWDTDTLSFNIGSEEGSLYYTCYRYNEDKMYRTSQKVGSVVVRMDSASDMATYFSGTQLMEYNMYTGEKGREYTSGGSIAGAVYCGDDKYEIICEDGTLEYIEFSDDPYCINRVQGDGTGITNMAIGGEYMVAYMKNAYQVLLYHLNEKSTELTGTLQHVGSESMIFITRRKNLICLNTSDNTYTVNLDNLDVQVYESPISYLELGNDKTVAMDDYDGSYTMYDADTGEEKSTMTSDVIMMDNAAYHLDTDHQILQELDYDTGEVVTEYAVPEDCVGAAVLNGQLVCECRTEDTRSFKIYSLDGTLIEEKEIEDLMLGQDFLIYIPAGTEEQVVYDLQNNKDLMQYEFGNIDWYQTSEDGDYLFVCTTDNGGFMINTQSGMIVLSLQEVSAIHDMTCFEDSSYFSFLYIEKSGSTRLDIYDKENPDSPIASIPGAIGINEKNQVLVYDGEKTIYATDILSKETIYQQGTAYVGSLTLTDRQKQEYHCE